MSIEEFNAQGWTPNMNVRYHRDGKAYPVASVDFSESLVGLAPPEDKPSQTEAGDIMWVRCENVTFLPS